jgi:hypothetical protein
MVDRRLLKERLYHGGGSELVIFHQKDFHSCSPDPAALNSLFPKPVRSTGPAKLYLIHSMSCDLMIAAAV